MNEQTSFETTVLDLLVPPFTDDDCDDWQEIVRLAATSTGARRPRLGRPFWSGWRFAAVAALAAGLLSLVAVWPFRGESVLGQALAAIGSGQLTHVVLYDRLGDQMVDLRTGTRTAVHGRMELWYDPHYGLVAVRTFRGGARMTWVERAGSKQGRFANLFAGKFVTGYRAELRAGSFHVTGSGSLNGTPVYWIESKAEWFSNPLFPQKIDKLTQQVAISKTTYKPVFMRTAINGHVPPRSGTRVVSLETLAPQPDVFRKHHATTSALWGITPTSPAMTLARARSSMGAHPPIVPTVIAGIRRSQIAEPAYLAGSNANPQQIAGVRLVYGHVGSDRFGSPAYSGPYVSITEFPTRNAAVLDTGLSYFPDADRAILENTTVTLRTHGLYVIITASDARKALAAAKLLVA